MTIVETQGMIGYAPGWKIRCTACGKTKDAAKSGVVRVGGWAPAGKHTLGWCTRCRRLRLAFIYKDKNEPVLREQTQRDETWNELLAYVSEGTIDASVAEKIFNADASDDRKREVAAHLAEGAVSPDDALRMLDLS